MSNLFYIFRLILLFSFFLLWVSADVAVNLDEPLLQDGLDLLGGQSVLQTVPDKIKINSGLVLSYD